MDPKSPITDTFSPSPSPTPSSSSAHTTKSAEDKKKTKKVSTAKAPKNNNKGERITFELDDVLRKYSPEQFKVCKAYDVGGVNILNKKPVDSKTALDKIKRRRETHNRVERRRRDCINQLIEELTSLLPKDDDDSQSKCHRVNVLRTAVTHIQTLTKQNEDLNRQLAELQTTDNSSSSSSAIPVPRISFGDGNGFSDSNLSSSYTSQAPHSPHSPHTPYFSHSPRLGPHGQQNYDYDHMSSQARSTSYSPGPSSMDIGLPLMSSPLPSIPMIIEPSESMPPSSPTDSAGSTNLGSHAKRLNRQALPRLQLFPPPFHHHRSNSNHSNSPSSPSFYGPDSLTSPGSAYSGYSSASGPWSSSSLEPYSANSSTGPFSSHGGSSPRSPGYSPYGPPSPYSPYSASNLTPTSPTPFTQLPNRVASPRINDWDNHQQQQQQGESSGYNAIAHN